MTTIGRWWPVALVLAVLWTITLALTRCAVAEIVARCAVYLYTFDAAQRDRKREEWLRILEDMTPAERPAHAGSLLWAALRRLPVQILYVYYGRLGSSSAWQDCILLIRADTLKRYPGRFGRAILRINLFLRPSLGRRMFTLLVKDYHRQSADKRGVASGETPPS